MVGNNAITNWDNRGLTKDWDYIWITGDGGPPIAPDIPGLLRQNLFKDKWTCLASPIMVKYKSKITGYSLKAKLSPICPDSCPYIVTLYEDGIYESTYKGLCRKKGTHGAYKDVFLIDKGKYSTPKKQSGCTKLTLSA